MKTRRVLRYQCDHCPKSGCGKAAMMKHEQRCFANVARVCPICTEIDVTGNGQPKLDDIIAAIDTSSGVVTSDVREVAHQCPACIVAAIVQRRKRALDAGADDSEGEFYVEFNYRDEIKELLTEVAREQAGHLL